MCLFWVKVETLELWGHVYVGLRGESLRAKLRILRCPETMRDNDISQVYGPVRPVHGSTVSQGQDKEFRKSPLSHFRLQ